MSKSDSRALSELIKTKYQLKKEIKDSEESVKNLEQKITSIKNKKLISVGKLSQNSIAIFKWFQSTNNAISVSEKTLRSMQIEMERLIGIKDFILAGKIKEQLDFLKEETNSWKNSTG